MLRLPNAMLVRVRTNFATFAFSSPPTGELAAYVHMCMRPQAHQGISEPERLYHYLYGNKTISGSESRHGSR